MQSNMKMVLGGVGLVVVAAALYFGIQWYEGKYGVGSAVFSTEPVALPSGDNTDNESLEQDTAAIDAELKALDADSASAEASLSEASEVE